MAFLRAEAVARAESRERFAELAAAWFTRVREELLPELDRGLKAGPSLAVTEATAPDARIGPPGGTYGQLRVQRKPMPAVESWGRYTDRSWQQILTRLASDYPFHVDLFMQPLDEHGRDARAHQGASVGLRRIYSNGEWVTFSVMSYAGAAGEPGADQPYPQDVQRRWAEFIKGWVASSDAQYAHVCDDPEIMGATALEAATHHDPETTIPRCRDELRGYCWVTVCAAALVRRLGGARGLKDSGAFDEVTELPGGQVFLRATPVIQDYTGEAVRRVFLALAPVLLTGRPDPMSGATRRGRLVPDADAADYR